MRSQPADWLTEDGAYRLAKVLRDYWRARGFAVATRVAVEESAASDNLRRVFCVRSDMTNGLPVAYPRRA